MSDISTLEQATELAKDGYKVFPLVPGNKKPLTKNGCKDATGDQGIIRQWWTETPNANLGLSTTGLLVVDLDQVDGIANPWPTDLAYRQDLEKAPSQVTANGGIHRFFRQPEGADLRNSQSKLAPKVDTRANGGYVVASPSQLSKGKYYQWGNGLASLPPFQNLPLVPDWLFGLLKSNQHQKPTQSIQHFGLPHKSSVPPSIRLDRAKAYFSRAEPAIQGQAGSRIAMRVAIQCFEKFDLDKAEAWEALQEWNSRCLPPWSVDELVKKIEDADKKVLARGTLLDSRGDEEADRMLQGLNPDGFSSLPSTQIPATPTNHQSAPNDIPFPINCLPKSMRYFVESVSASLQVDPAFVAVPGLTAVAGAIGGTRSISLKRGWTEPAVLWTGVVAPSGATKTPALKQVLRPFWAVHEIKHNEYKEKFKEYERAIERYERSSKKENSNEASKMLRTTLEEPKQERVILGDCTIQKLAEILSHNPRGSFCALDELAGWFSGLTRYASSGSSDLPQWLSLHSGEPLVVDRKANPIPIYVRRPLVSLTGGIQPGILSKNFTSEMVDSGAAARFLFAMPPSHYSPWTEDDISDQVTGVWSNLINQLLGLQGIELEGSCNPIVLELDSRAKEVWIAFYNRQSIALDSSKDSKDDENSFLSKLRSQTARLALILAMADRFDGQQLESDAPIPACWMEAGVEIAQWFAGQRKKMKAHFWANKSSKVNLEDKILTHLTEAGPIGLSKSDIHTKLGNNQKGESVNNALSALQNRGLAFPEQTPTGGRDKEIWKCR